ncbi:phosphoserine aminotransferase [Hyphomonas neptunium ATCC 15444]|uniref:phosphoserine transaminase n=2 Tax=Hyphomonas TaxID=85 RepID=Q0BXI9_HYPNA|nr:MULTISPECIES: phosphoserine transaminase [Hyphomonas]ABI75753.1 phosphoserine aminotransferase [Hyphomonas neptunium ATCC 15444]KCZ89913.1 phosphoserine aminotransferase [Hyphomonas hirschiana VP5]
MTVTTAKPAVRPACPHFSSGPTAKYPGFSLQNLVTAALGRSHRSGDAKKKLKAAIDRTKLILGIPEDYRVAIVPASDTGAVEMCMWSMLGVKPVDVFAWESFGQDWVTDAVKQLKLANCNTYTADYGQLPDFAKARDDADIIFTWNGTTSGVRVKDVDWIKPNPDRVVICDATSAAFSQDIAWEKLDVVTYSWQKCLGGEAAHGMLILSPNAVKRLESYTPDRPLPKLFRMTKGGKIDEELFQGATINTPSMLCVEDYLQALDWVERLGGWKKLKARSDDSLSILTEWEKKSDWIEFLCKDTSVRSNTGVTFLIKDARVAGLDEAGQRDFIKKMMKRLETENACFDAAGYAKAPPGLRIWVGGSVEPSDVKKLLPWLDWAFQEEAAKL